MKKLNFFYAAIALAACLAGNCVSAQKPEEIRARFPGEEEVILNHTVSYQISVKDGTPYVESTEKKQILYLSEHPASYLSKYGYYQSSFHELKGVDAFTQTADGKKVKVTDFKTGNSNSEGIFYDDLKETTFDFPALARDAMGNLVMRKVHRDPHLLMPAYFAESVPLINGELSISFPKYMSVKYIIRGYNQDKLKFTEESRHGEITYTFTVKDLPGERAYPDAPDNSWYALHVIFYIEKYRDEQGVQINYLSNTDDLYRLNSGFLKGINHQISPELKQTVDSLTAHTSSQDEMARKIYSWVQKNIKYVAFEDGMGGFIPRDASLVCSRRFGDCKDMSSILTMMLKSAGIPAFYTWIGTRHLPYQYSELPLPLVANHMISTILLNDKYIFLDGTDDNCEFGTPSEAIQGKEALLAISDSAYKIVKVPVPSKEKNVLVDSTFLELTDKGIRGNIRLNLSGYYAMNMHSLLTHTNEKDQEQYFKSRFNRGSNKFRLNDFQIGDRSDFDHLSFTAHFDLQDYARKIADEWYLNLNLLRHYEHQEIDFPKRKMPIEFPFLSIQKYVTVLQIPEGYTVTALPESKSYKNDVWRFDLKYEQQKNQLILTQEFDNDHLLLTPDKFQEWNKVLENLIPAYRETVSLSKK